MTITGWAQTYSVSSNLKSEYMGFNGAIFHEQPVLQTDLSLSWPSGVYTGIWHSVGFDDKSLSSNFGDEVDIYVGWARSWRSLNVNTGTIFVDVYPVTTMPGGDVLFSYLEANTAFNSLSPFVRIDHSLPLVGQKPVRGTFTSAGLRHQWAINQNTSIKQEIKTMHDTGTFGFDAGWLSQYLLTCNWHGFNIHVRGSYPLTKLSQRQPKLVCGGGYSFTF